MEKSIYFLIIPLLPLLLPVLPPPISFYLSYQRMVIDAKSILGVMGLGVEKELTVKYGGKDLSFENVLSKYTVA